MAKPVKEELVDLKWVARRYGYAIFSVQIMAKAGRIPGAKKAGSRWRVNKDTLVEAWG